MKLAKKIIPLLTLGIVNIGFAQTELTLPFMENIQQSTYVNPTALPDHKVSIGLPVISSTYVDFTNTGFTYKGLKNDQTMKYDPYKAMAQMDETNNYINIGFKTDLLSFRVKARDWYFMFNATEDINTKWTYPKDLFAFILNGNGAKDVYDFSTLGFNASHIREYGLGITKDSKNFTFGGRFKLLQGLANVYSTSKNMRITTDNSGMGQMSASADGILYTSGSIDNFDAVNYANNWNNKGAAIDLGVTYKMSDKWHFTVSMLNVGFIDWKTDVRKYSIKGQADFAGADVFGPYVNGESFKISEVLDSLKKAFVLTDEKAPSYRTWQIPQFYGMVKYNLTKHTSFGASYQLEKFQIPRSAITVYANQKVGRFLSGVITYSYKFQTASNLGLGLVFKPGPFDIYFVGDNMLVPAVQYIANGFYVKNNMVDNLKSINFRVGMNLVFGRIKRAEHQSYWGL